MNIRKNIAQSILIGISCHKIILFSTCQYQVQIEHHQCHMISPTRLFHNYIQHNIKHVKGDEMPISIHIHMIDRFLQISPSMDIQNEDKTLLSYIPIPSHNK